MAKKKSVKKYSLPFVNDGEPFNMPNWTYKKQEEVLKETSKYEKDLKEEELDRKYRNLLILKSLRQVDETVKEEDLEILHPDDKLALFAAVYYAGKRGILSEDFRQREKEKSQKQQKK
jgi:hypothetical protein